MSRRVVVALNARDQAVGMRCFGIPGEDLSDADFEGWALREGYGLRYTRFTSISEAEAQYTWGHP